jgi:hypothetical protein
MRSRDANHTSLFRFCAIIISLFSSALFADDYLISYRYSVKDSELFYEKATFTRSMQPCETTKISPIYIKNPKHKPLEELLFEPDGTFFRLMSRLGLEVVNNEETNGFIHHSLTLVTFKTRCFKVDVNEKFVIISALNLASDR